jgi:hypothetical protein
MLQHQKVEMAAQENHTQSQIIQLQFTMQVAAEAVLDLVLQAEAVQVELAAAEMVADQLLLAVKTEQQTVAAVAVQVPVKVAHHKQVVTAVKVL